MLLTIDVGNTQSVFGVFEGQTLQHHFRLTSDRHRTYDEYGVLLREVLHDKGLAMSDLSGAVLASVVPPLTAVFKKMVRSRLSLDAMVIGPGIKTGMPILYDNPREVGADRIVNGVAGFERFRSSTDGPHGLIIVDFGTATTFDVVSPQGEYMGGAIAPGVGISAEALFQRASKLPRIDLEVPQAAVGKTTATSMQSGILYGYVGLVDGMVRRMESELAFKPKVIATGGIAMQIAQHTETVEEVDDFLTLKGLEIIHRRNQRRTRS